MELRYCSACDEASTWPFIAVEAQTPHTQKKIKRHLLYSCSPVRKNQLCHIAAIMKYKVLASSGCPYSHLHSSSVGVLSLKCSICLFFSSRSSQASHWSLFLNERVLWCAVWIGDGTSGCKYSAFISSAFNQASMLRRQRINKFKSWLG